MNILVFGNPLLQEDSLPLKLIPDLKKSFPNFNFLDLDPTENLEDYGRNLTIIDTIVGIEKVTVFNSLDDFKDNKVISMHDFDLLYNLKLLKKLDKLDSVKIIGIPVEATKEEALDGIKKIL